MAKHTRIRQWSAAISVFVLLAIMLSACVAPAANPAPGAAPAAPAAPVATTAAAAPAASGGGEVKLWTEFTAGGEKTGIEALLAAWDAKNTGIKVTHRPIGNEEFFTVIRTGLAGGEPPDVLQYEGYQQTRDFVKAGQLTDLTEWWNLHKDHFNLQDAGEKACMVDGKMYCIPMSLHTGWQIYYNPDILKQYGIEVPKTFEDLQAAAETLKKNNVIPIALGDKDGWPGEHWWMNFLVQRCGVDTVYQAINKNGAKFTDKCFVDSAADLAQMAKDGDFPPGVASDDYGAAQAVFLSGKSAFFQTGSWWATGWQDQKPAFEPAIAPFPAFKDNPHPGNITAAMTHVLGIPAKAANKDGATKFLDFIFSDEAANIWAANGTITPIKGAVDKSAPEPIKALWKEAQNAKAALPWIENELPPGVGEDKVYNGTVGLVSGTMTPEQFGKSIQDALDAAQ